jgi:hypothetical protein
MATTDLSRSATNFAKNFDGVRMQQGRVLTDDDFNENERLHTEDIRKTRVHVIGPSGSPDNGFAIASPQISNGKPTFLIKAGTFYLGGLRLSLEADEFYHLQKDWLQQGENATDRIAVPAAQRFDFVYLETWRQPVSAVEDNELFEVGLGGPDTSVRTRTMHRVRVRQGTSVFADCEDAFAALLGDLAAQGALNDESELVSNARLRVTPDGTTGTSDLCSPPVAGGYLGAENQAIRVQLLSNNTFTWGFDNAAPVYRVELTTDSNGVRRRIVMRTEPKDQAHWPLSGQVIELLPWSAGLVNNQKLADLRGHLAKVNGSYNPDTREFFIDTPPPAPGGAPVRPFGEHWRDRNDVNPPDPVTGDASVLTAEGQFFYLRVWNRGSDTSSPATMPFVPATPISLAHTGLQITFTGTQFRATDFWIIAARPDSPTVLVPWDFATSRAAHGVRRWLTPLAVIQWTPGSPPSGIVLHDCRPLFLPLTRIRNCCTYTVGDGTHSHGHFTKIQTAIEALPAEGGRICVLAGVYDESVVIDKRVNIRIHGCGPESRVRAITRDGAPLPAFLISNSTAIVLEDMAIESGPRSAVQIDNARHVTVRGCLIQMRDLPTLWQAIFSCGDDVLIESNVIEVLPLEGGPPVPTLPPDLPNINAPAGVNTPPDRITLGFATRGGIQLAGGSDRVSILRNIIRGGIWNGITLGSLRAIDSKDPGDTPDTPVSEDPCDPCAPVDLTEDPNPPDGVRFESAGDLYDIRITGNRISDMGISGIGVVRFFDLANGGDMIGVHGLHITDNFITRCVRRFLAQVSAAMQFFVAYGGIALAKVTDLRILRNEIVANGTRDLEPICGVFAIFVQALQLDDNRILDNGPKTDPQGTIDPQKGLRGGVHIWMVLPSIEQAVGSESASISRSLRGKGIPTCSMRDNIIIAPLGRAVTFFALGQVVVARNRLVTQGTTGRDLDLIAATVLIGNLGLSNEWTLGLIVALLLRLLKLIRKNDDFDFDPCQLAILFGAINPNSPPSFWPPLVRLWNTGKTLVTENQITLDVPDEPFGFGISSILIFTLDDLGMTDNQCEITSTNVFFYFDALLAGGSVREADNRFSETWMHALLSSLSLGGMNTTTDNQSTHCLFAQAAFPNLLIRKHNLAFVSAFCPGICGESADPRPND